MNKTSLKKYMEHKSNSKQLLKSNCFNYEDKFLISDSYSIIVLNNNYDLDVSDDTYGLVRLLDGFNNGYEFNENYVKSDERIEKNRGKLFDKFNKDFSIQISLFERVRKVIKANKFTILKKKNGFNYYSDYAIKLENTKSGEYAYMLPARTF